MSCADVLEPIMTAEGGVSWPVMWEEWRIEPGKVEEPGRGGMQGEPERPVAMQK